MLRDSCNNIYRDNNGRKLSRIGLLHAPGNMALRGELDVVRATALGGTMNSAGPTEEQVAVIEALPSEEDLVCMKLAAIGGRGAAKDFWDLHALLEAGVPRGDLREALELFRAKYPSNDRGHIVKALAYFGDADAAPLPAGLTQETWAAVKAATVARVRLL